MFRTIFAKQFVFYICVLLVGFITLAIALFGVFNNFFVSQEARMLEEQARRISMLFRANPFGGLLFDERRLLDEVEVLHVYLDSSFIFINANRTIHMATADIVFYCETRLEADALDAVFDRGDIIAMTGTLGGIFTENVLTVAYPVHGWDDTVVAAVLLSTPMPELQRSASEMFRTTLFFLLISAVFAFALIFMLSRTISKPLRQMNEAAKVIASGDFEKRIEITSKDEVGQLAESFNNMAHSLFEQDQMRRVFITNVSHDLRSPLTSIRGFLQAILDGTIPPEKQGHYLHIVMDETIRLTKLTHDIIDLNRIQSPDIHLNKTDFDLNTLIRKTVMPFESVALRKNIAVSLKLAQEQTYVHADEDHIQRVLYNLIDNAVKFSPKNAEIIIETTLSDKTEKKALITVKDNGRGITTAAQKCVFDRFYKADTSRGEDKSGVGLGLSIVAAFVKAHGETITLETAEGKGCTFSFKLPLSSRLSKPE